MAEVDTSPIRPPELDRLKNSASPTIPTKLATQAETAPILSTSTGSHLQSLQRDGFVVVRNLLPPHLLLASQASCKYLIQRTRPGGFWPFVRTVPKQYPPWPRHDDPKQDLNIWGIQHLLHPELTGLRDVFAEVYFSNEVLKVVKELLSDPIDQKVVDDDQLVMELFNLLISPARDEGFELEWHRDDIKPDMNSEEEERLLKEKAPRGRQLHAQYNIALFEDESLIVVPGSHRRVRMQIERDGGRYSSLPDEVYVKLQPGDAVFYDSNILHRGSYAGIDEHKELGRMTLHGSVGLQGYGQERSRQVLQHGVGGWVESAEFSSIQDDTKRKVAESMRKALIEMGSGRGDVGYSLTG